MWKRTEEDVWPTVGILRHIYFVGFLNVPVQAPARGHNAEIVWNQNEWCKLKIQQKPNWGRRGFKSRVRPPYPQRVVKGD